MNVAPVIDIVGLMAQGLLKGTLGRLSQTAVGIRSRSGCAKKFTMKYSMFNADQAAHSVPSTHARWRQQPDRYPPPWCANC